MNKERRVGRRSVALKLKLTPENENSSSLNYQSIPGKYTTPTYAYNFTNIVLCKKRCK